MATKRLSLMLDDGVPEGEASELEAEQENLENIDPHAAKRHRPHGKGATPMESPLQRMLQRQMSNNSCTLSPITELSHNMRSTVLGGGTPTSSTLRSYNSASSCYDSGNSLDDEYMAMFELESMEQLPLPGDLDALISGQLKTNVVDPTTERNRSVRRCLSMESSQQQDDSLDAMPLKLTPPAEAPHMRKAASMNDAAILNALADEPALIGDLSKPCALPVLLNGVQHRDLKTISCDTLARLMRGEFAELLGHYQIIDCRYPYEFDGGHIRGALNLYTRGQIKDAFPAGDQTTDAGQRRIYVFHCEFSSERGPKLLRFLRSNDRQVHMHDYPTLDYPEVYLLQNGYKEFFSSFIELCDPRNYVPMLAPAHNEEYRLFRAKTKSWQCSDSDGGDSGIGGADGGSSRRPRSLRKSRSRLLYAE